MPTDEASDGGGGERKATRGTEAWLKRQHEERWPGRDAAEALAIVRFSGRFISSTYDWRSELCLWLPLRHVATKSLQNFILWYELGSMNGEWQALHDKLIYCRVSVSGSLGAYKCMGCCLACV